MQSNLPRIKTNYTFTLIDTVTNKVKQCVKTHNEMTQYFWYIRNTDSQRYQLFLGADDDIAKSFLWYVFDSFKDRQYPRKNTIRMVFTVEAAVDKVGEIRSFGIYHTLDTYTSAGSKIETADTKGTLKDAEGNPISINKTALDKLIIEVEWEFQFTSDDFVFFDDLQSEVIMNARMLGYNSGYFSAYCRLTTALQGPIYISTLPMDKGIVPIGHITYSEGSSGGSSPSFWGAKYSPTWKQSADGFYKLLETNVLRIPQSDLPMQYINQIGILGLGSVPLPNTKVFPIYTLQGIDIGVGDGTTTTFECPIPWFLKNTDKLYKNGQLLTRDVDYTIDHKHNRQKLTSISEGNFAKIIQAELAYMGIENKPSSNVSWGSYIIPFASCLYPTGGYDPDVIFGANAYVVFKTSKPLILDMEKATEINYFVSPQIHGGSKLKLFYSNDNSTYTYVGEVDVLTSSIRGGTPIPDKHKLSFDTIKARYWKIEITSANGQEASYDLPYHYPDRLNYTIEENKTDMYNECGFLGYVGEPIKFKNPPAEGDIITMDVSLDRPYKTTQNVIDIAFKYNY